MIVTVKEINYAFSQLPELFNNVPQHLWTSPPNRYRVLLPRLVIITDPNSMSTSSPEAPELEFELVATTDNNIKTWKLTTVVSIIKEHRPFDERL